VISMPVGGHDGIQWLIRDDLEKSIIVIGRVNEHAATAAVLQQIGVVVDRSDADLRHSDGGGQS